MFSFTLFGLLTFIILLTKQQLTLSHPIAEVSLNKPAQDESPASEVLQVLYDLTSTVRTLLSNVLANNCRNELTWDELKDKVLSSLEQIMVKITNISEDLGERAFRSVLQLRNLRIEIFRLVQTMDKNTQLAAEHLNESLINHTEMVDMWTDTLKKEMRHINETQGYTTACEVVNHLIYSSTRELKNCCNITIKPIASLCRSSREVLANSLRILADLIHKIQTCVEDKNSYLEYMTPCVHLAYTEVVNLIDDAVELSRKISRLLPGKLLYSRCCLAMAIVEFDEDSAMKGKRMTYEFNDY